MPETKTLEQQVVEIAEKKLENLAKDHAKCSFFGNCEIKHVAEMVRLAHQIRSLKAVNK